jgi:hypothetical protein
MSLSDDAEAKAAGEAQQHKVTFVIEAGWTVEELVDRLLTITTSPRVAFQNGNRGKTKIPTTYIVPKAGSRAVYIPTDDEMLTQLAKTMTPEQIMEAIKVKLGVA